MIKNEVVEDLTQAYIQSYLLAMNELHNPQLSIQVAMGVTMIVGQMIQNPSQRFEGNPFGVLFSAIMQNQPKKKPQTKDKKETDNKENT